MRKIITVIITMFMLTAATHAACMMDVKLDGNEVKQVSGTNITEAAIPKAMYDAIAYAIIGVPSATDVIKFSRTNDGKISFVVVKDGINGILFFNLTDEDCKGIADKVGEKALEFLTN